MMLRFAVSAAALAFLALLPPSQSEAQLVLSPGQRDSLRERALHAMNAFEAWAVLYTPDEADSLRPRCEPKSSSPPHACNAGTIPTCIHCIRQVPLPLFVYPDLLTREPFVASERRMLATLDSAQLAFPGDEMFTGTLVFMLAKRGMLFEADAVAAGSRCGISGNACRLLRGFVQQARGQTVRAAAAFDSALARMPGAERCIFSDPSQLMDDEDRKSYSALSCSARAARDSAFWWLSDPSYLLAGNDRLTEHVARAVGNRILRHYRSASGPADLGGAIWYPSMIPMTDSIERFAQSATPWRWHNELSRFGTPDALDALSGKAKTARMSRDWGDGTSSGGVLLNGCGGVSKTLDPTPCIPARMVCSAGHEDREIHLEYRDTLTRRPRFRSVPEAGSRYSAMYPTHVFYRYGWSEPTSYGCARTYNTRARHQFTPLWRDAANPFAMTPASWQIFSDPDLAGGPPYREQYTPHYAPVSEFKESQLARLPRGDSMLVVAVLDVTPEGLDVTGTRRTSGAWETGLIMTSKVPPSSASDMSIVRNQSARFTQRQVLSGKMPTAPLFVGLEILTPDTVGFARMRTGLPMSPWLEGNARLSDVLFFSPDSSFSSGVAVPTTTLEQVLPLALGSLSIARGSVLGLYWETQLAVPDVAATPNEAQVTVALKRREEEPGVLGRLFGGIFGGGGPRSSSASWKIPVPQPAAGSVGGSLRWGNALSMPTNSLQPGEYDLSIEVAGVSAAPLVTKRTLTILRPVR